MTKSQFWRQVALIFTLVAVAGMTANAQPGGGGFGGFGGFGGRGGGGGFGGRGGGGLGGIMGGGGGDAQFALRADVKKELGLNEDQVVELTALNEKAPSMRDVMQEMNIDFRAMFQLSPEEREKEMAPLTKKMAKLNDDAREEVMDVLTSKQKDRFGELKFQFDVSQGRAVAALTSAKVELESKDEEELSKAMQEVNAKLQQKIAELRMQLYVEALSSVVSKSKVDELMGDTFTFDAGRQFGGGRGGQGGGQRGGAGGGRGGRAGGAGGANPRRARPSPDDAGSEEDVNPRRRRAE